MDEDLLSIGRMAQIARLDLIACINNPRDKSRGMQRK